MRPYIAAAVAVGLATPALADPPPLLRPSKDVAVEYHVQGAALGDTERGERDVTMIFGDHGNKVRFDGGMGHGYVIIDQQARRSVVVMTEQRMYMEHEVKQSRSPVFSMQDATFTRKGSDRIAGLTCTVYEVVRKDEKSEACITDDGLLLRSRSTIDGSQQMMEAMKVTYAPQPASMFAPPPDFQKFDMSAMMRGMGGGAMPPGMGAQPGRIPQPGGAPPAR